MKISEIREMPSAELEKEIGKIRAQLFKFGFHSSKEEMQKAGEIAELRKRVARMKTVQRERTLKAEKESRGG